MRRAARVDGNHKEIVAALTPIVGSLINTSGLGRGFPDLVIGHCGTTLCMEVKNPATQYGRKGLNERQASWRDNWHGGPYAVVDSVEAAIRAVRALEG